MELQTNWVIRGYFDLGVPPGGESVTKLVQASLASALGRQIRRASYPVGPAWRYALWWREGDVNFAEAQFFASLSPEYPILSVGVSVEKGLEGPSVGTDEERFMHRSLWDWPRFVASCQALFELDVPACNREVRRSVVVRLRASGRGEESEGQKHTWTFVHHEGEWFERHKGTATPADISEHVRDLDKREDWWVNAHLACDLNASEVGHMTDKDLTTLLLAFAPLRRRIRGEKPSGSS